MGKCSYFLDFSSVSTFLYKDIDIVIVDKESDYSLSLSKNRTCTFQCIRLKRSITFSVSSSSFFPKWSDLSGDLIYSDVHGSR